MPVVKSNAYGHGLLEVAKVCLEHPGVDRICVVSLDEALDLLKINKNNKKPIFILSFYDLDTKKLIKAIKNKVIFPLYTFEQAQTLDMVGEKLGKKVVVHIKVDTGATRTGLAPNDVRAFLKKIHKFSHLYIEGLWSHLASSEEDKVYTHFQLETFTKTDQLLKQEGIDIPLKHIACTASTILHPKSRFDAVRIGLGIYGLHPSPKTIKKINLKPVLSLYTKIIQVKNIPPGTKVGYGGTWVASKKTTLAIIPLGYFDGYDRKFSNKGQVIIKGKVCPIRGRICMNLTMVDVSHIKNVKVGDIVTVLGKGREVDQLAHDIQTINYEIVSRINSCIPRIYV
jgi:alanine racemase